jgi:molybdenum cofactor synthesis domain-containing protein
MTSEVAHTAAAIVIGNELLSGKVRDENVFELSRVLRALGVRLNRVVLVPDEVTAIASQVSELRRAFDVVFTSGGVGPTHDDLTIQAVARAFDVPVVPNAMLRALLERAYAERITPHHLRMASVPEGARLLGTDSVTWPAIVLDNVWMLPGVPEIFRAKLAIVNAWVRGPGAILTRSVLTVLDEPELKPALDSVVERFADVEVGSYPRFRDPEFKTLVTFDSPHAERLDQALGELVRLLPPAAPHRVE